MTRASARVVLPGVLTVALAIAAAALPAGSALAQSADRAGPEASAARVETAPLIDGVLSDSAWLEAPRASGFVQREPLEGRPASEATELRLIYDDEALYVGLTLYDSSPDAIILGENRRDAELANVDAVLLLFDTYRDGQNGFVFGTTASGIEYDGQVTREGTGGFGGGSGSRQRQQTGSGGGFNKNWDGSWTVATSRDDRGWYAEFRIPFTTLRYARGGPQEWGLNVSRTIGRKDEEALWAPVARQFNFYRVSDAGVLSGLEAPAQPTMSVTPFVLTSARKDYLSGARVDYSGEVGGDAKFGLTPSLTLDLTVNTDFAQVEVDDEQVNLTRFQLFFPEKRPFFLENAGTFAMGTPQTVELFFSRRIGLESGLAVPILAGARVTGKAAGLTVGALSIQTDQTSAGDGDTGAIDAPSNNFSAVRVIKELGQRSRLGAILVSRINTDDTGDYNLTYGVDGRWAVGESLVLDGYAARTETPGLTGGEHAVEVGGNYETRDWRAGGAYRTVADDFNPDVGFLPRSAYHYAAAWLVRKYRFPGISSWFRELRPHVSYREFWDLDGFTETRVVHVDSHFEFANGAFFQLPAINFTTEGLREPFEIAPGIVVPPGTYDHLDWGFVYYTDLSAPLSVEGGIDLGGFLSGTRRGARATLNGRLGDTFVASLRLEHNDVNLAEGDFETTIVGLRAAYSFTPRIYLQSLVQYNDLTRDWSSNIRFGWLNTAGTGLFLVYNDTEHAGPFRRTGIPAGPVDRTFVVKFTKQFGF